MMATKVSVDDLIEHRAKILAMVQFTSRPDVLASECPEALGLDLLVQIVSEGPGYQKFFGVRLEGTNASLPSADRATQFLGKIQSEGRLSSKYSFPVIVLLFSMEDDKGYYAWSIEPIVNRAGEPKLTLHETLSCASFNRSALATIVNRVNEWHDSLVVLLETV